MFSKWNPKAALCLLAVLAIAAVSVSAQQATWSLNSQDRREIAADKAVSRTSFPTEFKLFDLNAGPLRDQLFSAVDRGGDSSAIISLPNAAGGIEQFQVWEASNFDAALQKRFPEIRAFSGRGITDPYATLKLSLSPQGVQTMVFRTASDLIHGDTSTTEYIEPYSADHTVYAVFGRNRERGASPWVCSTADRQMLSGIDAKVSEVPLSNTGEIRTMRLAQSCNGEYANFFGATSAAQVALVLAAYNATLTRANGVYEKDLALHLNLINNTTDVIYYNPATDPYSTNLDDWNDELMNTLHSVIGDANFDIGHMFGASGGGGNAGCIGCVCSNVLQTGGGAEDSYKGAGITSPADGIPQGDNFDIDYVVHEVGHQLGGNHTYSFQNEGTGQNKEIGSGITIMGYAGITPYDVAPHSIDTYHETTIGQIQTNLAGKTCPTVTTMTANHAPVVSPVANATIPISTPFALTGAATDVDGDSLTYQWEQDDNATTFGSGSNASPTKTTGPNWLSFTPTASPTRYFPKMSTVLAGLFVTPALPGGDSGINAEALSSVSRSLKFRLTVRDNHPYVPGVTTGETQFTDTTVTVTSSAGPFKVTSPNTNVSVAGGTSFPVTWNVANTTASPVSVANVKISMSTDGGQTFPLVLSASTPNDGSESVIIPAGLTSNARIKVEAVGNIFFDVSDANFTVVAPPRSRADFDGDSKTDFSVFRPSDGNWYLYQSTNGFAAGHFGIATDTPVPGDYDGDGKTDLAVFRPSDADLDPDFYVYNSSNATVSFVAWGKTGDIPVVGDYDGDLKADFAVYRPSAETWYVLKSGGGVGVQTVFGTATAKLAPGDFDGDGKTDIAYYKPDGTFIVRPSSTGGVVTIPGLGTGSEIPVPADYSGDNRDEIALFTPATGNWFIFNLVDNTRTNTQFGLNGDIPVPGDYDGDGKDDIAVYRAGVWYVQRSSAGFTAASFGLASDIPIPAKYRP